MRFQWMGVFVMLAATFLSGQQSPDSQSQPEPQQTPPIAVNVKVVNVLATVRDKHGKIVSNLTQNDFTLEEDGKPVTIRYFANETNLPLTLGLLVDTSMSQRRVLDQERAASKTFLDQVLHEKDTAFLIHFDKEVELLQDLTASRAKLESALEALKTPEPTQEDNPPDNGGGSGGGWPGGGRSGGGGGRHGGHHAGTLLYDAVYLASNELMAKQQGRKALIILSDGVDRGSKESLETAIESAQRANTIVYSVLFKDNEESGNRGGFGFPGMGGGGPGMGGGRRGGGRREPEEERPDGKKILTRISKETGGRMFEVSKKQPIDQIYSSIQEELRSQYNLGFMPDKSDPAGYHKLLLKAKPKDSTVQAREGFYIGE
ncbi:MAG TPA: VWA domain-containing protein [Terriglobales bacterium]|jgi:VWFA-related protein|nr:VWA domain-containing protein [Terriglobales bacterium]